MSDFEKGRSYWIGSYPNFSFARPVVKKPTFLRLRDSFEYEIQSRKYNIPLFLLPKVSIYFEIKKFLVDLDLRILVYSSLVEWKGLAEEGSVDNENEWEDRKVGRRKNILVRRMELAKHFVRTNIEPKWIVLCLLPILPHELRPIFQIDRGKLTISDINELYRIVIYRNNTFIDLLTTSRSMLGELVMCQEKLVQEAVDTLLDNGLRGQPMRVGPSLSLHRCGFPCETAIELFQTFVICGLIRKQFASNIGISKSKIRKKEPIVWEILREVMRGHPILLNRAPTLHRLGIQAFQAI
ncbi:putative DNA-directed RNA polymerase [Lupinus albus]|uniref:DNA-directed RNA polymerase subunit n=1 Tax=Lupinus albus TaxID=3870 RepID=A0A6A4QDR7_LUPAL|nr:putative DNA-directed RNA polymerase [Lupinus albus]